MSSDPSLPSKYLRAEEVYDALARELADPTLAGRPAELKRIARGMGELEPVVTALRALRAVRAERDSLERMAGGTDRDLAALARDELLDLAGREAAAARALASAGAKGAGRAAGERGAILEIRAGTGGEEAALFAGDLLRMYLRHAERRSWTTELAEVHGTELGGIREAVLSVDGPDAWAALRHEGGVHRVQRVPATEAQGRIHTSAVSVAVLAQAEEVDVEVRPDELRVDTFCASGKGGQSVNTTYSAVRIVHLPTGITVQCQDERSQAKNKARAMKVLRARILASKTAAEDARRGESRRAQVGTGDRSEKIRTYNFPQNRVTDHRIGFTLHKLRDVMDGDLGELLAALAARAAELEGEVGRAA